MSNTKVLITDHPWPELTIESQVLAHLGVHVLDAPDSSEQTLSRLAADADAIATCWAPVTERVIQSATECRIICRMGIGLDNIDVTAATQRGIPVTNVPDYCVDEVADHALAQLLALGRNIAFFHLRTKRGEYSLGEGPRMHRLRGQTLGLIGLGRIGRAVYERALPFGLKVMAYTPSGNNHGTGCQMVSLDELLETVDHISIHAPLTDETRHMLDEKAFTKMKPGVLIANTSRGPLVDPNALWEAIQSNVVAGAALDVFQPEPPDLGHPLYQSERVIVTPHAAFVSEESIIELRTRVAEQIRDVLTGQRPPNIVNPEVLS
ncbi:MAG: C-terminal binding protein [Planctomycetaceae bacterium]|nr:C-terminal binding protein [Planctomycetaceae bacterium]